MIQYELKSEIKINTKLNQVSIHIHGIWILTENQQKIIENIEIVKSRP